MNLMERRRRIDLAIAACSGNGNGDARQKLDELFRDAEHAADVDMKLLAAALVVVAGGDVTLPPNILAGIDVGGGFYLEENHQTGAMRVRLMTSLAETVATAAAEATRTAADVDVPKANPAEPEGVARARMCEAVKLFLQRHYDGEIRTRGFAFLETVAGELLAMAVGLTLANAPDPDLPAPHLQDIVDALIPRVQHYQHVADQLKDAAPRPEPGEPAKTNLTRLM